MPSLSVQLISPHKGASRACELCAELLEKKDDVLRFAEALGQLSFDKETEEVSITSKTSSILNIFGSMCCHLQARI